MTSDQHIDDLADDLSVRTGLTGDEAIIAALSFAVIEIGQFRESAAIRGWDALL